DDAASGAQPRRRADEEELPSVPAPTRIGSHPSGDSRRPRHDHGREAVHDVLRLARAVPRGRRPVQPKPNPPEEPNLKMYSRKFFATFPPAAIKCKLASICGGRQVRVFSSSHLEIAC